MPMGGPMSNQSDLDLVRKAIESGLGGCVEWDDRVVDRVSVELARYGLKVLEVRRELIEHVRNGGDVIQVKEVRTAWLEHREYWYKVIVPMPKLFKKGLF